MTRNTSAEIGGSSLPIVLLLAIVGAMIEAIVYCRALRPMLNLRDDPLPAIIAIELAFGAALALVIAGRSLRRAAAGAGLAFAVAVVSVLGFALLTGLSGIGTGAVRPAMTQALRPFVAANVIVIIAACWSARRSMIGFAIGVASLVLAAPVSVGLAGATTRVLDIGTITRPSPLPTAVRSVVSITACLMRLRAASADGTFPRALAAASPPGCDLTPLRPGAVPDYTLTYESRADATGRVVDFRVLAMPRRRRIEGADPLMSDSQGVVFQYMYWSSAGYERARSDIASGRVSASLLPHFVDVLRFYMRRTDSTRAPASIDLVLSDSIARLSGELRAAVQTGVPFRLSYAPSTMGDPARFTVSSTCTRYGDVCIRSFFFDDTGHIHATAEPRPATAADPLIDAADYYDGAKLPAIADWPAR